MAKLLIIANDESTVVDFRLEVLHALVVAGYKVIVAYPLAKRTNEVESTGCNVVNLSVSRHGTSILQDAKLFYHCWQLIGRVKPDVVLTYTVKPNIYGSLACVLRGVRYLNNVTGLGTILQSSSPLAKLILFLQKLAYLKSSCVFFQNRENYQRLLDLQVVKANTPFCILPGSGVNLDKHAYVPYPEEAGKVKFVMVSRIRADKGYHEYFIAAERIKKKYSAAEFHVVGGFEEESFRPEIERLVAGGVLIYHGALLQSEVHQVVASCHCLVHPSYHEGMANVLLEAAAAGRPVIASDIPGCREAFEEGVTGLSCRVQDADSLYQTLEKFLVLSPEQRAQMGLLGRRKMEREFDRRFVAQAYLEKIDRMKNEK